MMKSCDYPPADLFGVGLALEEALTNAAIHGNGDDPAKRVRVAYEIGQDELWCEVEDEGLGFSFADVPDPRLPENVDRPHGRGLLMMRLYMSDVDFQGCGNCVVMRKHRSGVANATEQRA